MNFSQFLAILRARWLIGAIVLGVTVAATLTLSLLLPKQYTASASVVVDIKPDPVSAMIYPGMTSPAIMATQVDIIQSDRVAQRVVRNLKLVDNPQVRAQWKEATNGEGSIEQWLADNFQRSMDVKPSRESNVITVTYRAPDPRFAAALANAFVQAYVDTALELRVDPAKQYSTFFDTRAKESREALEKAQSALSAFQREKGIIANDERLDVENSRLNDLSTQLVLVQGLSAESGSRQAHASGESAERMQEVLSNPVVAGIKADLARQEAHLKELNSRYGENHPQVVELKANIGELRAKLADETKRVTGGVGVTANINRQREAQIRADLEAQRAKVLRMKQVRDEGAVLMRDVENAQRSYDAVISRLNQTSLESQTTQSNVEVLTPATPPLVHSSPKIMLNTFVALFVGALLGCGIVLLLELMDRRVRATSDIAATLGLPVIGVMPLPNAKRRFGRAAPPALMQDRVVGRLTMQGKGA